MPPIIAAGDIAVTEIGQDVLLTLRCEHHNEVADLLKLSNTLGLCDAVRRHLLYCLALAAGGASDQEKEKQTKRETLFHHSRPPFRNQIILVMLIDRCICVTTGGLLHHRTGCTIIQKWMHQS